MTNFKDKKILITGGASGIGRLMAKKLAKLGALIFIVDINEEAGIKLSSEIKGEGGKAHAIKADLGNLESMHECKKKVHALAGTIDILINNAGIVYGGEFEKVSIEKHLLTFKINTSAPLVMTHLFFDDLRKSSAANIVNIASASGFVGLPYGTSYASSKWAAIGFSESLRLEILERKINNIHVTTVCPSYISTGMFKGVRAPFFLPWLKPEVIVDKIILGIQNNSPFVKEPFLVKGVDFLKGVLPLGVFTFVSKLFGISTSMTHWKGRAE